MKKVLSRACCRVDFAGGTLDIWPLGLLHPDSCTVNLAISVEAVIEVAEVAEIAEVAALATDDAETGYSVLLGEESSSFSSLEEMRADAGAALLGVIASHFELPPSCIAVRSDSPRGAGLGGSSAISVALIAAIERYLDLPESTPSERSRLAQDLEAGLMGLPTGRQDHYPALLGGALEIRHLAGGDGVRRLDVDLAALGECLVVAYTGKSHFSAGNNWEVVRRRLDGDPESARLFEGIAAVAGRAAEALESGDLPRLGRLMAEEWAFRRQLADAVSTPGIEELLGLAADHGAWGGKACGAGGGGCVAMLSPADRREEVAGALAQAGAVILDASPSAEGIRVHS